MKFVSRFLILFLIVFYVHGFEIANAKTNTRRKKIGLVLSGGGARGFAHIGVLKMIEKAGLKIDYIGGTSMGSIIGALYAVGYSANSIEEIMLNANWKEILRDKIQDVNLSMEKRVDKSKFFLSFPIRDKKISLPSGLVAGQNIFNILTQLTLHVANVEDFSKFPIPFLCIGTDIIKGKQVVLRKGSLPNALRASIAIPSVFSPVEINGKLLVDGGLVNNLPVDEVKAMGGDIIIGVNVGFKPYSKKELGSIIKVLEQSVFIHNVDENKRSKAKCNVLIEPSISQYSGTDFYAIKDIIARGERAAKKNFSQLKRLAITNPVSKHGKVYRSEKKNVDSVYVRKVIVEGADIFSENYVKKLFNNNSERLTMSIDDIENGIKRVFGSQFFSSVLYEFENSNIKIKVDEVSEDLFKVGFNYNSDFDASIILSTAFRNVLTKKSGDKLDLSVSLGTNPYFVGRYTNYTGIKSDNWSWLPDWGIESQVGSFGFSEYRKKARTDFYVKNNDFSIVQASFGFFLDKHFSLNSSLKLGTEYEYVNIKNQQITNDLDYIREFGNFFINFDRNTLNEVNFPTEGSHLYAKLKFISTPFTNKEELSEDNNVQFLSEYKRVFSFFKNKLTFIPKIFIGVVMGEKPPPTYEISLGSFLNNYKKSIMPFMGGKLMQLSTCTAFSSGIDMSVKLFKDNYLIASLDGGSMMIDGEEGACSYVQNLLGYGITYGYNSPVGPIKLTVMKSNISSQTSVYINLGVAL